jgi:MerR family transcriptional regulator, light-induced transcriptional regulator
LLVGGAGARDKLRNEAGVRVISGIGDVGPAVRAWRDAHANH